MHTIASGPFSAARDSARGERPRRSLLSWLAALGLLWPGPAPADPPLPAAPLRHSPNLLLIITDDQRCGSVGDFMPQVQARIFDEGVTFTRAYATTPLCGPSRASILTGRYAHNHQVYRNTQALNSPTFVEQLHAAGYTTGMIGKYVNQWSGAPRPEYDYWVAPQPNDLPYENPTLNVNGAWVAHEGYTTTILGDYALDFLDQTLCEDAPFFLMLSERSPHLPAMPADGDETLYPDLPPNRPPNFNEQDVSDKPAWFERVSPLAPDNIAQVDHYYRLQLQALVSLDASIAALLDRLEAAGRLDRTAVLFISDNGLFMGEHRLAFSKERVYETVARIPFALRYPRLAPAGTVESALVANIDIAPTLLTLAGLSTPAEMNGRSLTALLTGGPWRTELLLEGWPDGALFAAAHTGDFVYVETVGYLPELYDLKADPFQLDNRVNDPKLGPVRQDLSARLAALRAE